MILMAPCSMYMYNRTCWNWGTESVPFWKKIFQIQWKNHQKISNIVITCSCIIIVMIHLAYIFHWMRKKILPWPICHDLFWFHFSLDERSVFLPKYKRMNFRVRDFHLLLLKISIFPMKLDQNIDFSIKIGPKFINFTKTKPFIHQNLDPNIF